MSLRRYTWGYVWTQDGQRAGTEKLFQTYAGRLHIADMEIRRENQAAVRAGYQARVLWREEGR